MVLNERSKCFSKNESYGRHLTDRILSSFFCIDFNNNQIEREKKKNCVLWELLELIVFSVQDKAYTRNDGGLWGTTYKMFGWGMMAFQFFQFE